MGPSGREPGRWIVRRIRGGDLIRAMRKVPGRTRGRCLREGCGWSPAGTTPHNIGRELMRHTRKTGHQTQLVTMEDVRYLIPKSRRAAA